MADPTSADYAIHDPSRLLSPSLVVFLPILRRNLEAMVRLAGSPDRLRPHVKTHKMPALVRMTESYGIRKHKCATIAEAEMLARTGAIDVLLAYPLVGPNLDRFVRLCATYRETVFRVTVDDLAAGEALSRRLAAQGIRVPALVDLDVGMIRTGVDPAQAFELYIGLSRLPNLTVEGIHAYDGHAHEPDPAARSRRVRVVHELTLELRNQVVRSGLPVDRIVLGGTPTFPMHAALNEPGVELSPGTCILHDVGYGARHADLPFMLAAGVLTRVVSRPRPGMLCLDVGHKAIAADPPAGARMVLPAIPDAKFGRQNEEHLVVETQRSDEFPLGAELIAIPSHICPTCALHRTAYVIDGGVLVDEWEVAARDRVIGI